MKRRSAAGMAPNLHLARSARLAGEAFAFAEPDGRPVPSRRISLGGLAWLFVALAAVTGLYLGL